MFKIIKKMMLMMLAVSLLPMPTIIQAWAEDINSADTAFYEFSQGGKKVMLSASISNGSSPDVVSKDGKQGWQLKSVGPYESGPATINVDIDSSFAYDVTDGSTYEIEIDYYDEGKTVFSLVYAAQDRPNRFAGSVRREQASKEIINDADQWRTATFRIQDARFDDSLEKCDFQISANILNSNHDISEATPNGYGEDNDYGPNYSPYYPNHYGRVVTVDPIVIGAVRVKRLAEKNPLKIKVTMDTTSNTLFDNEPAKFNYDSILILTCKDRLTADNFRE